MTKRLDPHDGWTPEVQVEEQPPMSDNGARALAERLDAIGAGPDGCEYAPLIDVDVDLRSDDLHHGPDYAAAILANGAVFLPDAAELDRLRRIEAAARVVIAGGVGNLSPPKYAARVAAFDALDDALEALQPEGSARDGG